MVVSKKKLNIAIVCDPITDYVNGAHKSALRFSKELKARGHKVIFIASRAPHSPAGEHYDGIRTYRFPSMLLPKTEKKYYLAFPRVSQLKKIFADEHIDVVHIMLPTPAAIVAARAAKALDIKMVAHSHAQPENIFLHLPLRSIAKPLNSAFNKYLSWLYKQTDHLIYPSKFAESLLSHLASDMPSVVISNGVDTRRFKEQKSSGYFASLGVPRDAMKVLYVGRLHPEKSLETLIKAAPTVVRSHPNVYFFIVGDGHLDTKLQKLINSLGMKKNVRLVGQISDNDLVRAYNDCDVFVLPSLAELEGMVVLEAMACGKPVIVADSPASASRFFVDGNGLLFKPEDHDDLSKKLLHLIENDDLRREMGVMSSEKIKAYDLQYSITVLEEVYYKLFP